jgi:hypothetical protein
LSGAAKAFVVINLVLALLFAGASASYLAQRNLERDELKKVQAEYTKYKTQAETELSTLKQTRDDLQGQVDALTTDKGDLERRPGNAQAELDLERKNRAEMEARLARLDDSYGKLERDYARLADRTESLEQELAQTRKTAEEAVAAREDAIDARREAEQRAEAATTHFRTTAKELQETRADLIRYRSAYPEPAGRPTPAEIYGKVESVESARGIVVISVGEDDGVKPGMEFTVYRGDGYVGKVVVEDVDKELSVTRVDRSVSDTVKVGDNVSAAFLLLGFVLVQIDLYAAYKVLWLFKLSS